MKLISADSMHNYVSGYLGSFLSDNLDYSEKGIRRIWSTPIPVRRCHTGVLATQRQILWGAEDIPVEPGWSPETGSVAYVEAMKAAIRQGESLDPVVLYQGNLIDGYHRVMAHHQLGIPLIDCMRVEEWVHAAGLPLQRREASPHWRGDGDVPLWSTGGNPPSADTRIRQLERAFKEGDPSALDPLYYEALRAGGDAFGVVHEVIAPADLERVALMEQGLDPGGEWREWAMGVSVRWKVKVALGSFETSTWKRHRKDQRKWLLGQILAKLDTLNQGYEWSDLVDSWSKRGSKATVKLSTHVTISRREFWCDDAIEAARDQLGIWVPDEADCDPTYYEMDNGESPGGVWWNLS